MTEKEIEETIIPKTIEKEMKNSYMEYAMSVIVGRALPDVRDGLKPVHRRVLFAMHELGNTHDKPYKKSARITGEVMGKFHPHGDQAIYDTIVRMTQNFSLRYPLIDGQGNFGSIDGDNAAAMRYTEIRMNKICEEMVTDIDKETVGFVPNFDGTLIEPVVLPSKIPNLLINGSSGIAVGMATNIPPHNLTEVVDALTAFIDNPEIELHELMQILPGPDFPTGGKIVGKSGILSAYSTGRGIISIRGKTEILEDNHTIKIVELPYQVNKAELVKKIAHLVRLKSIEEISDIKDKSDRTGMEIEINLKKGSDPNVVLNKLYVKTDLEKVFGIINLALVNNEPKFLSIKQMLREFIRFRTDIVTKRCKFELKKSEERHHILCGLIIALENIDEVVALIKKSDNPQKAREELIIKYLLTEIQANSILDMKLSRLTGLERTKIEEEQKSLEEKIKGLKEILENKLKLLEIIKQELEEIKTKYGNKRKTELLEDEEDIVLEQLIPHEESVIIITQNDYVKRISLDEYKTQKRGGKGMIATGTKEEDIVKDAIICDTHDYLMFFSNKGVVRWMKAYRVPQTMRYAMGKPIINLLEMENEEKIQSLIKVSNFSEAEFLVMTTKKGLIKRTSLESFSKPRKGGIIAIKLTDGDELIDVRKTSGNDEIFIATKNGFAIHFEESQIRETGRVAQGVRGIRLRKEDEVVGISINISPVVLTITENGFGKRTLLEEYRKQTRGGKGIINIQTKGRNGNVVGILAVNDNDEVILISSSSKIIRMQVSNISMVGRNTKGVRLMRLDENEQITAIAHIPFNEEKNEENTNITETQ
ncbi:DNA gyrase subunit A [Candidatus Micrarchaeota archaeon]|nr:DNA gyrase subunit A [Candidatus Micrarchaeota archaeon]